jgi:hypothetical protein
MRKLFVFCSISLGVLASGACSAAESSTCQPGCADDKRECSALAQHEAKGENSPLAIMNEKLPHIRHSGDARGRSIDVRAAEHREFENRRMARARACDDEFMKCIRACTEPADGIESRSVVLKRQGEL